MTSFVKSISRASVYIIVFILILLIAAYLFLNAILDWATRKAIDYVTVELGKEGMELRYPEFKWAGFTWINAISVKSLSAHMAITQHNVFQIERNFYLDVKKVTLSLVSLRNREILVIVKNAVLTMQPEYGKTYSAANLKKNQRDRLDVEELKIRLRISSLKKSDVLSQIKSTLKGLAKLAKYGKTEIPLEFKALSVFVIRDKEVKARLYVERENTQYVLLMNKGDYGAMCRELGERLTGTELDLYSRNPLRVPRMTRIRNYASDQSREINKRYPEISEDAYKHILWAFLLLNAYDEKFSQKTTDAHEVGVIGRSELAVRDYLKTEKGGAEQDITAPKREEEIQMDLINNAIGRDYAKQGCNESALPERVRQNTNVIHHWMQVKEKEIPLLPVPTIRDILE